VIFDTDVLIWFFRGNSKAARLLDSSHDREVSIVSLMELIQGARSREEVRVIRRFFPANGFRILPLTESISHLALTTMEDRAVSHGLRLADALIAATVRDTAGELATGNVRHFRAIPGIKVRAFRPE
jgi:hypothetical protein